MLTSHTRFLSSELSVALPVMAPGEEPGTSQFVLLMDAIKKVEAKVKAKLSQISGRMIGEEAMPGQ